MRRIWHGRTQITDSNGNPEVGAKLEFFAAGTANQLDTFSDYALGSANTNPVISDSGGWVTIFLTPNTFYDYTTTDSDDVTIYDKELNIYAGESVLTTKGDLHVFSTDDTRLPVGTNGQVVVADSAQASGIKWGDGTDATLTTKGDLRTYDTDQARLPVGNDNSILVADSGETTGLKWAAGLVRATSSGTQVLSGGVWTTIACDTETQDSDGIYNNSTYTATIADPGWYIATGWGAFGTPDNNTTSRFLVDGTDILTGSTDDTSGGHTTTIRYFAASTTIVFQIKHGAGASNTLDAGAIFQLRRIG